MRPLLLLAAIAATATSPLAAQSAPSLTEAQAMAAKALAGAREKQLDISVVIVNREGRVILANRMDGSSHLNLALAEKKAVTAGALGAPTSVLEGALKGGETSLLSVDGVALTGGGVPVKRGGAVVGGIGVSGGSPQDDEAIATDAAAND